MGATIQIRTKTRTLTLKMIKKNFMLLNLKVSLNMWPKLSLMAPSKMVIRKMT